MKRFFKLIGLIFQFIKCLSCAHRNNCEHSLFVEYKGVKYVITAKSLPNELKEDKKAGE